MIDIELEYELNSLELTPTRRQLLILHALLQSFWVKVGTTTELLVEFGKQLANTASFDLAEPGPRQSCS